MYSWQNADAIEIVVRSFCLKIVLNGTLWKIEARKNFSDLRFSGKIEREGGSFVFVIVRSATGKWLISGNNLPHDIVYHAQSIGKALHNGLL